MNTSFNKLASGPAIHAHALVKLSGMSKVIEAIGHEATDLYLAEFGERLKSVVRPQDKVVRLHADKFCLILNDVKQAEHVELAAAKLIRAYEKPATILGDAIPFDVNAGYVLPSREARTSKVMLQSAESALRHAQSTDQDYVIFSPTDSNAKKPDLTLLPRIEQALELGEFVLYYQPKISAVYSRVSGAEALIRWHDEKRKKVITPFEFIETAENGSVIYPLTEFVVKSAIAECSHWDSSVGIAVNITPKLLETDFLIPIVTDTLALYHFDPTRLTLEITERGELPELAIQHLQDLQNFGVKISIDDFGTGQCSLAYFRDLPADEVKIDRSFISNMAHSKRDRAIVHGIIDLAHYCDMQVVAEGIEDKATADRLIELGCNTLQGYFYGKPVTSEQFRIDHLQGLQKPEEDHFSELLK